MAQSTLSKFFTPQDSRNLQHQYNMGDLETVILQMKRKSDNLNHMQLNIAVMGDVGSGKSTFINAMRGLQSDDQGAAPTGNEETRIEPTEYPYQDLPHVQLWDLPGTNSFGFELNHYLTKVNFENYDFFIIISQSRFRENDADLAKKIQEQGKEFYYVRAKIDNDVRSLKRQGADLNEGWDRIRRDCVSNFQSVEVTPPAIFLISSFDREEYDFPELKNTLARDLPRIKSNIFSLSIPKIMTEITEYKQRMLQKRVWILTIFNGSVGALPLPLKVPVQMPGSLPVQTLMPVLSFITIVGLTVVGWIYLRKQLGVSDKFLQRLASKISKPSSILKAEMNYQLPSKMPPAATNTLLGITLITYMITRTRRSFSPMTLSIFGAVSSFVFTYKLLKNSLSQHLETVQQLVKSALTTE
ncbi:T-cell-specific guanine nucleotide triphosphate-binding protein 2-like [Rhincodon typus]|uniref:T-cell-specific guanine nucleotide triphosphate-binding protein 2-like n=1 Tax=Rhincodon typus TaxID=259920 RepID=UPI00202E525C|nr:T-cell-specific guanine nucleotide triphosphate-binding protein 2-like [Rhincodon typus]XP_048461016.1 T-cell-specific guanine nucleotide triphosphate-binding protein 2-like [Rhincodon typus]XP_048461017.1 T-cell-specific guanine nucleotide triphosphate-binding protein 2-like [Rhincodon typus]XP_048461018.1 T-cell-specific guanine nucleotide triphosphate-binding protein 2-like [Rhincodon typus]